LGDANRTPLRATLMTIADVKAVSRASARDVTTCRAAGITPARSSGIASETGDAADPMFRARLPWT